VRPPRRRPVTRCSFREHIESPIGAVSSLRGKVDLVAGEVTYPVAIAETVRTAGERGSGIRLSCRAVPTGDVVIQLRDEQRLRRLVPLLFAPGNSNARTERTS